MIYLLAVPVIIAAAFLLKGKKKKPTPSPQPSTAWEIGPVIGGRNYSVNLPSGFDSEFSFGPDSEPHYITRPGSLAGKKEMRLRYRVEMAEGVRIYPPSSPASPSLLTLYFATRDNDWRRDGGRWWASFARHGPIEAGDHEIIAPFDGYWTSVTNTDPAQFREAIQNADRVGFTFGGGDGLGHGVRATGPVRFIVTGFEIVGDEI